MNFLTTDVGRLRLLGMIEGVSMLLLLFVAMPLKYWAGKPEMVTVVGQAHGLLFILLVVFALYLGIKNAWSFKKVTFWVWVGSVFPFGTFVVDHKILKKLD